eukprot:CAMPEP_0194488034 /NCGR_PEP_ID=MMETSP0253-20130528/8114_1 /TAXON_ID=2966 /ORGANISM="Noctiluca scintillans" /LENGTH=58 /DNA_ID=CAMNT_0039328349 /DNA_START=59 /DNA_END=232 /DNA_ORIENTATION=+
MSFFLLVLNASAFWATRLVLVGSAVVRCTDDGSNYEYSESVSGDVRTITTNHCPNHPT